MKAVVVLLFCLLIQIAYAQDDSTLVQITLVDGSKLVGTILEENEVKIVFQTRAGAEMDLKREFIAEIETITGEIHEGVFRRLDPNRTRLLFAPTARTIKGGSGYFSIYEVFLPMVAYGVTDYLTLSGGLSLLPGIALDEQLLYFAPKIRLVHSESIDLSTGVLYMTVENKDFGIAYGVFTFGKSSLAGTIGLGWGFFEGDFSGTPAVMVGGEWQISGSVKLITENWFPPDVDGGLISFGIRFFGASLAADLGLITTTEAEGDFPFLPWIGFAYNF
jgi:hypothetical protein